MDRENLLWLRVAALRGIQVQKHREHAHLSGQRFQVEVSGTVGRKTVERVSRLVSDASCNGVVGEIAVRRNDSPKRARVPTFLGVGTTPLDWRRALIEREAERLARTQPDRLEND